MNWLLYPWFFGVLSTIKGQLAPSAQCLKAKEQCHANTDCLHRVIYLHSTCTTGTCQTQCKTAVLNLFQISLGRKLLVTDLSCLSGVKAEMLHCRLVPTLTPMHCVLARDVCSADDKCLRAKDIYEMQCENSTPGQCTTQCASLLAEVFRLEAGKALLNCICWRKDVLCQHFKKLTLDSCADKATSLFDEKNRNNTSTLPPTTTTEDNGTERTNICYFSLFIIISVTICNVT